MAMLWSGDDVMNEALERVFTHIEDDYKCEFHLANKKQL